MNKNIKMNIFLTTIMNEELYNKNLFFTTKKLSEIAGTREENLFCSYCCHPGNCFSLDSCVGCWNKYITKEYGKYMDIINSIRGDINE